MTEVCSDGRIAVSIAGSASKQAEGVFFRFGHGCAAATFGAAPKEDRNLGIRIARRLGLPA
jgi:hypothetical protein